jgi:hypothetical protein
VYRFVLSTDISAPAARVWHALCDPEEVAAWDDAIERALDAPPDYPTAGQHVRWRYREGPFRVLHDRPREVVPEKRLRSLLSLGPFRYDETYVLEDRGDGSCRLTVDLTVWTAVPVIGPLVDRAYLGPATRRAFQASLAAVKIRCEARETHSR